MPEDFAAAVTSAVAEATAETTGEPTPAPETPEPDKPQAEPEAPEPSAAPKAPEPTADPEDIDFINPTAEDLAAIEASPELKRVYKSMQRGLTKKTTELAAKRKEYEQANEVVSWIRSDPETAIRTIAQAAKIPFGEAKVAAEATVADTLEAKWAKTVGDDAAKLLRPLFEETARAMIQQEVEPLKSATAGITQASYERGIAAGIETFGAQVRERGEEWDDEIQGEMAKIADSVNPSDTATLEGYISHLYDTAMARRMRTKSARANLERLKKARQESEPVSSTRPTGKGEERITNEMSDKDAVAIAVRQAKQGLGLR